MRVYAVAVVKGLGKIGHIGGRTGFAVAEHGNNDDVVGGEGAIVVCECKSGVDAAAIAGWYADCLSGCRVVGTIGDFYWQCSAIGEGKGGNFVVFDSGWVVRWSRHFTLLAE